VSSQSQGLVLPPSAAVPEAKKKLYQHLYFQVLCAIVIGILLGHFYPSLGESMKPLGDGFIKLIKMLIAPIIFFTVVHGIASTGDLKKVGRVGIKALIYFEVMTTLALAVGYISMKLVEPGVGMNVDPSTLDATAIQGFTAKAKEQGIIEYLMHIIPSTVVGAFAEGDILQVLLLAILFAFALQFMGERGKPLLAIIDTTSHAFFGMVGIVMKVAPLGAFGAMAFTIGKYGIVSLLSLGQLLVAFYATCFIFVFVVLGGVAHLTGFSLWRFLKYIKEELLLVLGTSSSESALPRLIAKLEVLGCEKSVVGLVVPSGYSFNLDGSCIMLTTMAIFVAQATNTSLSFGQEIGLLGVLLLTSKGAAGVTGGAFIALAATLASIGTIPVAGLALVLGVYRFISEAGSLVNLIGNGVATVVVAKWEGALDETRMRQHLEHETDLEADEPEKVLT
jgi:aerobic C4-dicarboxylate transport protein